MIKTHTELTVEQLLTEDDYAIPLYQRNFAWSYDEIAQLLNDIADAYQEKRENYYIGSLVASQKEDWLEIIDGQQRTTALTLISLALRNMGLPLPFDWDWLRLQFPARRKSQENLEMIFKNRILEIEEDNENEITLGYRRTQEALKTVLAERKLESDGNFINYLFKNVLIFRSILPSNLDLNLYFERFNSRGEQLEAHEIIKAQMMAKFGDDQVMAGRFAKIWDACADFDKPVLRNFQSRSRPNSPREEAEKIFGNYYTEFSLTDVLDKVTSQNNLKQSLLKTVLAASENHQVLNNNSRDENQFNYTTVIDFPTLLLHTLSILEGEAEPTLDDKKLLNKYNLNAKNSNWVKSFADKLLTLRHIFDTFVIKNVHLDNSTETEWQLKRGKYEEYQRSGKGGWYYVRKNFTTNTFSNSDLQKDILMLQSMFAVTFTANSDSRWLYETLQFLFEHVEELHQEEFGQQFKDFLEDMAVRYAQNRIFNEDGSIKSYLEKIPVYAFNFIDYVLWKNREDLKKDYEIKTFEDFKFTYRRSIEHWYPQNPIGEDGHERLADGPLHSIGNLCIVTDSQNSKFSNLNPSSKFSSWKEKFPSQSLKLQMMAQETEKKLEQKKEWDEESIAKMEATVKEMLDKFMNSK